MLVFLIYQGPTVTMNSTLKGNEVALQKALHMVHKNENDYASVLFYSARCPFSGTFRPKLSVLSSLYPSIPHFAIEESSVRPRLDYQHLHSYVPFDILGRLI